MVESESLTLSEEEKHLLENYDSRQFGFVRWFEPVTDSLSNINHGTLLRKGTEYLLGKLRKEGRSVDPVVFCKLGHYHILLEEFVKAMSAYQRYFGLQEQYFKDAPFLYGLGIVYYHFNAYQWAIKAFQQLLYVDPSFSRANEVHLRLGLMFKTLNNFDASLKHLQLALLDSSPCSLSKVEIQFHIAHLFEIQSKYDLAKDAYQAIIAAPGMPTHIQSVAWRQLGWMYHIHHQLGENTERIHEAVNCLQKSLELDPSSGSSWYFLGRCYAQLGKIHDAFTAYRHAIDKAEANADTWCSIGVLYHQQSQPMDALQAYVCAVQLDNQHVAAWTDLGVLYETGGHFADAMVCYTNAHRACGGPNKGLETRMKILQEKMISPLAGELNKSLPTIEEAWKLPIPAELTTRTVRLVQQARLNQQVVLQAQNQFMQSHAGQSESDTPNVKQELEPKALASAEYREQTLHHTGHGQQARLSPVPSGLPAPAQSEQLLRTGSDVSYKSNVMDSLDASTNPTRDLNLDHGDTSLFSDSVGGSEALPHASLPVDVSLATTYIHCDPLVSPSEHRQLGPLAASTTAVSWSRSSLSINSSHDLNPLNVRVDKASLSDQNLNQINSESELLEGSGGSLSLSSALAKASNEMRMAPVSPLSITVPTSANDLPSSSGSPGVRRSSSQSSLALSLISPLEGVRDHLKMGGMGVAMSSSSALLLSPHLVSPVLAPSNSLSRPSGSSYKVPKISLLLDEKDVPRLPARPAPLPLEQLYPPTPSITVTSRREAMSPALRNFCIDKRNPVTVIKGMCKALKLDLSMFTTRRLVEQNPDHPVEIRHQRQQPPDENWDEEGKKKQWYCWSSKSKTTIAKYAQYQASTYQESLKPNQQPEKEAVPPAGDSDSSNSSLLKPKKKKFKMIKFGTNVDLSDTKKWKPQLAELTKLPGFCKVVCGSNMLCHVGHNILGMNTVQLYMKIPGCRTPGHQENNCLAALNINIGPGDCEWFSVDHSYWGVINELCEKHNLNFLSGSWWPILEELCDERVPVHRFIQKPGDLVFINTGNVHWVQSLGWCNNIAWNVGPLVANQFSMAVERYEWNKMQGYKSIVPMINLTWGLSRNIRIPESKLAEHIKVCLYRSLHYCEQTLDILRQAGIEVHWHGREKNEAAHYCSMCEVEVFNLLFVKEMNKKLMVHCQDCARKTSATLDGFLVLNQYTIEELRNVYSAFCANMVAQHTKGQHPQQQQQQQQKQPTQSSLESQKHDADPAEVVEDPAGMAYGGASPVCEQDLPQDQFDADSMQHLVEPKLEPASEYDVMDVDK